ncbi:SIS domain-containing protein [Paenibacillus durus]|uniref:SIS domain-containing protein n=1 Tax=Paenibacillus durus TaxID=44251 RepID=UPI0009DDFD9D|nr:SIS domain-containing protein [Paenibacillus durus]
MQEKLFINVSKSGETDSLLKMSNSAKKNGIKIISFTGDSENSLSKLADISLKIVDMDAMDDRNKSASSFYPNVLMLFEFLIGEYLERIKEDSIKN